MVQRGGDHAGGGRDAVVLQLRHLPSGCVIAIYDRMAATAALPQVKSYVDKLLTARGMGVTADDIGVISPYRRQVADGGGALPRDWRNKGEDEATGGCWWRGGEAGGTAP